MAKKYKKGDLHIRTDDKIDNFLNSLSEKTGKRKSDCVRDILHAAESGKYISFTSQEDYLSRKELIREVDKIGVNINQIAHNVNAGIYSDYEKRKLFALVQSLENLLDERL